MLIYSTALLLIVLSATEAQNQTKDWTRLTLSTGAIRGRKVVTAKNTTAYLFHGIPYAEAPVGDLRFRAPTDKKSWKGELETTTYKVACMSSNALTINDPGARDMSEDCLHANVFTTEKCMTDKNCPVLYYIFGGAWNFGTPFGFPDELLVENYQSRGIVLVTVTYRLGSLGFFNTGKRTSADKNLGILDMIHGLRWTQREIGAFGGDKNKVSIMGHSSGSAATDLISLSPKTGGLFNQVIPMSGPAGMSTLRTDSNVNVSRAMAVLTGCATLDLWDAGESFDNILKCMRNKTATELIDAQRKLEANGTQFSGPVIDEDVLPESVESLLTKRRPYRLMIGTTNREFRTTKFLVDGKGKINQPLLYATCVMMAKARGFKHPVNVGRACADDYAKRPSDIADLSDDMIIYLPTYESGEAMRSKGATVYKYSFEYDQIGDAFNAFGDATMESPFHAQDLVYVMGLGYNKFSEKDKKIQQIYSGMFADFIKSGDPSPPNNNKWEPTDDRNNYFKINFDDNMNIPGNTNGYHANAVKFWKKTAPELDQFYSKWDINGTFNFKQFVLDLIEGLKGMGQDTSKEVTDEIKKWTDDLQGWTKERVDRVEQVLTDIWQRIENATKKGKRDHKDDLRRNIVEQQINYMVRQILPTVREDVIATNNNTDWKLWFWVVLGVAVVLAVILLATCCCCHRAKRYAYDRVTETSGLNPSSSKTYG